MLADSERGDAPIRKETSVGSRWLAGADWRYVPSVAEQTRLQEVSFTFDAATVR